MAATSTTDIAADVRDPFPFCDPSDLRTLDPALVEILARWAAAHRAWRAAAHVPGFISPECHASAEMSEELYAFVEGKAPAYFHTLCPLQVWLATEYAHRHAFALRAAPEMAGVLRGAVIASAEALEEWHLASVRYTARLVEMGVER